MPAGQGACEGMPYILGPPRSAAITPWITTTAGGIKTAILSVPSGVNGLFRVQWGDVDVIRGGWIVRGHVTPPAWSRTRSL
jgi:hypothetical protein